MSFQDVLLTFRRGFIRELFAFIYTVSVSLQSGQVTADALNVCIRFVENLFVVDTSGLFLVLTPCFKFLFPASRYLALSRRKFRNVSKVGIISGDSNFLSNSILVSRSNFGRSIMMTIVSH